MIKVREVSGTLVVTLPRKLAENFDIRKGDYVKQTFSKDKIVLKIRREHKKRKKTKELSDREIDRILEEVEEELKKEKKN